MEEIKEFIKRIEGAMIDIPSDEWAQGFNKELEWAIRILNKDKSAY